MLAQAVDTTPTTTWALVAVGVIIVLAIVAVATRRRRSKALRKRYGPEYDRTVAAAGSPNRAETELERREQRHRELDIRPLTPGASERYAEAWRAAQARFVDDPGGAVADADRLVGEVMRDRGYPVGDAQQRYDDLSVDHAAVLGNYRFATDIARRNERGEASTEDLRQALVSYRALFRDLLGADPERGTGGSVESRIVEPRARSVEGTPR